MTAARHRRNLSQRRAVNSAAPQGFFAGGWRVTRPSPCPRKRAVCRALSLTRPPRVARDIAAAPPSLPPRAAAPGSPAAAVARRRGGPGSADRAAPAPAVLAEPADTPPCRPAASSALTAPRETTSCTRCSAADPLSCGGVDHDPAARTRRRGRRGGSLRRRRVDHELAAAKVSLDPPIGHSSARVESRSPWPLWRPQWAAWVLRGRRWSRAGPTSGTSRRQPPGGLPGELQMPW